MPMPNDSYVYSESEVSVKSMKSPRKSTLNFIRQMARSYVAVNGVIKTNLILN